MPAKGIQHIDLSVADVDRSLAFYVDVLVPLGLEEEYRVLTYRGTEEVVYLKFGSTALGLRPADGGVYRHYEVGIEHLAFGSIDETRWTRRTAGAFPPAARSSHRPRTTTSKTRTTTRSSPSTRTGSGSRSSAGSGRTALNRRVMSCAR